MNHFLDMFGSYQDAFRHTLDPDPDPDNDGDNEPPDRDDYSEGSFP